MENYNKEKSLVIGIVGLISFFIVLYFEWNVSVIYNIYWRIGYAISFSVSLLALYFAIKSTLTKVED